MDSYKIIRARRLIDGTGKEPVKYPVVVVKNNLIMECGTEGEVDIPKSEEVKEFNFENGTILPGLMDFHIHLTLGTYGGYDKVMQETDGIHLITGVVNAREALHAGITTMRDAGGRNRVPLDLREAWKRGLIEAPRLLVSGRPLTITGGHFYFCNDNEADGIDNVRRRVRQFIKEGVDVIKIMASGGGSNLQGSAANVEFAGAAGGPAASMASFNEDELRAAVEEAHKFHLITTAHCEAVKSVRNAARAGIDVLEHCGFILPNGKRGFDEEAVRTMVRKELHYCPTYQTGSETLDALREKEKRGETLSREERFSLESLEYKFRKKGENLARMVHMGVKIVAGSDATGIGNSTRLIRTMELMVEEAGLSPMQVIVSATSEGAKTMKMDHLFGTIRRGLEADIIAVKGDPSKNIRSLRSLKMVMQGGNIVILDSN